MKPHVKLYHEYFGYHPGDFIPCEVCGTKAVDIHHIEPRGMGGTKQKDKIGNIMALCRSCHTKYGDKKQYKQFLKDKHNDRI